LIILNLNELRIKTSTGGFVAGAKPRAVANTPKGNPQRE
jgi:hypothetical protein